jgi:hypothetical protein
MKVNPDDARNEEEFEELRLNYLEMRRVAQMTGEYEDKLLQRAIEYQLRDLKRRGMK